MTKALVSYITPWLVDYPDELSIVEVDNEGDALLLELSVHPDDIGKVIGKRGRIIRSLRSLAKAAGQREGRSISVEVVD